MTKTRTVFACIECGAASPRWHGRCPTCGAWNALQEERLHVAKGGKAQVREASRAAAEAVAVGAIAIEQDEERWATGIDELDRVLGGGFVRGGVVLLGGDPGIGKSTLLLQALAPLAGKGRTALYVTGEESAAQVALRAKRLGCAGVEKVQVVATTDVAEVEAVIQRTRANIIVIDSVQTLGARDLESAAGTISQLREVSARLTEIAKRDGVALVLVGHVTKDGGLAGPKVLEHLVDTVLWFEGERDHSYRVLRASKNRFGPASEVGVFEMAAEGLREVADPSAMFLRERRGDAAGSVVVPTIEGSRPVLVELQALVAPAVYGAARRVTSGVDSNRVAILLAVLERKAGVHILDQDVFVSTAGGARTLDRAADVALALAIVSSFRNRAPRHGLAVFGEIGLTGEVRGVSRPDARVAEALRYGFSSVMMPASGAESLSPKVAKSCVVVRTLEDVLAAAFD